ncbi:ATP-dependent DNA helicase Q5-like [Hylaeus anthracinus]|uniref:ATP-dependent DNA helicase Q5-like n=1 Tax=Hylaeus anthracinus TaxID=313031 RepID=UPI0023B9C51E|nr:ATP-dependent DNA helicase Q5-like [Hylaeus anthracinus]
MNYDISNLTGVLRSVFGYENFKNDVQKEATIAISTGSEYVCISMPPGFGRNLCFQLPVISQQGKVGVVFSPKLSLMKKHVDFLRGKHINARLLNKSLFANERKAILKDLTSDTPTIVLLYCSLEIVMCPYFKSLMFSLKERKVLSYIVFDEAHCLSKWGYEYKPSYKKISVLHGICMGVPTVWVTTTVTDMVIEDICKLLTLKVPRIFRIPVQQINVHHDVWFVDTLSNPLEHLKSFVIEALGFLHSSTHKIHTGLAIVYCREEVTAELIKNKLNAFGIPTVTCHHKQNNSTRRNVENMWISGEATVITTTYDYGFIYKKPIRCTVYWTVPKNLSKYYRKSAQTCTENGHTYCRIYFSMKEYSSVKLLIEKHDTIDDSALIRKQLCEYDKLVDYCLSIKCRHAVISEYFGYTTMPCETNCDVCKDKEMANIRTLKFITYSKNVGVKYSCDSNEDDKKQSMEILEDNLNKFEISCKKEPAADRLDEKGIVQCNDNLAMNKQKPSSSESSSVGAQLFVKDSSQTSMKDTIKCVRRISNVMNACKLRTMQVEKHTVINGAISFVPPSCGSKNKVNKKSAERISSTRVSSERKELKNESRTNSGDVNSVGSKQEVRKRDRISESISGREERTKPENGHDDDSMRKIEKRDRISKSDSCDVIVIFEAIEQTRKRKNCFVSMDTYSDEFKSKRRKLRTENKSSSATRIQMVRGTSDQDKRVERVKDNADEIAPRGQSTVEHLMEKYKLNKDSITLVPRNANEIPLRGQSTVEYLMEKYKLSKDSITLVPRRK